MQKIINLTPHAVTVVGKTYPASGLVARVKVTYEPRGQWDGCQLVAGTYGEIEGLPTPLASETIYIVSTMVRQAAAGKISGLASPAKMVRDAGGNIIGCEGLEVDAENSAISALRERMAMLDAEQGCYHWCCGSSSKVHS